MKDIYIAAPEQTTWRIPPEEFASMLSQRWPNTKIAWDPDPKSPLALDFTLDGPHGEVIGSFHKAGTFLALDRTDVANIGPIAVWFRSLVPPQQPLLLCSGSGIGYSELKPTDTAEEVSKRFSS